MAGQGKDVTSPTLDFNDFMGLSKFGTFTDGKLYQLPDQQFANLYWFRYDWFQKPELKAAFKAKYGYELGVPVNWSAYEDIADFFTNDVKEIDGQKVYGHMDYGKKDPSLGWRFTDAWLSMAGAGDRGLPNGKPVDEWGIRARERRAGRLVDHPRRRRQRPGRGVFADQVHRMAEEVRAAGSGRHGLPRVRPRRRPGPYRAADLLVFGLHRFSARQPGPGDERGRHAQVAHGPLAARRLLEGGHEARLPGRRLLDDAEIRPIEHVKAGWLYAQFCTSKTVSLKKALKTLHLIRESDVWHPAMTDLAPKVGGLVEFYRSPARKQWTPTGVNVPDYAKMSQVWWQNIANAISGQVTPQAAMDGLARDQDAIMARLEKSGVQGKLGPKMNKEETAEYWYARAEKDGNLAPQRKLANEKPKGETVDYDALIKSWPSTPPKKG